MSSFKNVHGPGTQTEVVALKQNTCLGPISALAPNAYGMFGNLLKYETEEHQTVEVMLVLNGNTVPDANNITVLKKELLPNVFTFHIHYEFQAPHSEQYLWFLLFDGPDNASVPNGAEATIIAEDTPLLVDVNFDNNSGKRKARVVTVDAAGSGGKH